MKHKIQIKTRPELLQHIIRIISKIHNEFPELSKYINEMPVNNSVRDEINNKNLEDYYHSLKELVNNYADAHQVRVASARGRWKGQ